MIICVIFISSILTFANVEAQCNGNGGEKVTFSRWTGRSPELAAPVFVYAASGEEESLAGACLARCRELPDCAGVAVAYARGNCHGIADSPHQHLRTDNEVTYFKKICLPLGEQCTRRWWSLEVAPGYNLHSDNAKTRVVLNTTIQDCYEAVLNSDDRLYRSAQWVGLEEVGQQETVQLSDGIMGNCLLHVDDKFTEPESYRVSNYYTFYIENQCRHDYPKKIDRCSYEEYYNQTLKHVEFIVKNYTKDECKAACETEEHFVCRGFTWTERSRNEVRGLCDLHSEDLVTTGSWLLRRIGPATYYRRVICLNISVECEGSNLIITYTPRSVFRGRVYVPGRGEQCSARLNNSIVRLSLPFSGDCDVNFAHGITYGPSGIINRTMAYVMVMVQNNPIIQTAGDRWVRVGCSPEARHSTHVDALVAVRDTNKPSQASESTGVVTPAAASAVYSPSSAPLTMYVVRDQADGDGTSGDAVALGEPLELRIETTGDSEIEAYHLVASSRLGDSSVLLLDSKGCSTGQVDFPPFVRTWIGGTQRLSTRFKAFRFPTSHVVRFALMVRFCDGKCDPVNCRTRQSRKARDLNATSYEWSDDGVPASIREELHGGRSMGAGVVAQGGAAHCPGLDGRVPLELEMVVGSKDILSANTLIRADHQSNQAEEGQSGEVAGAVVCVHELLLVALALAWLAVQILLLLGCCILVKRYRNLAELSMQKDYQAFDNVGFDTLSTHRRVHWPDQTVDILHAT